MEIKGIFALIIFVSLGIVTLFKFITYLFIAGVRIEKPFSYSNYLDIIPVFDIQTNPVPLTIGYWPGSYPGVNDTDEIRQGTCEKDYYYYEFDDEYYCINLVNATKAKPISIWKGIEFKSLNNSYYQYLNLLNLSVSSTEECPSTLKQCGLLDTMNNKMCIDKDKECPINMLTYKKTAEPPTEYNYTFKNVSFDDSSYLYYTNEAIDHHILGRFRISDGDICINSEEYNSVSTHYVLDYYDYNGCKTEANGTFYDSKYIQLDSMNKYELYKQNGIIDIMKQLPNYPYKEFQSQTSYLYYAPYIGYNKECFFQNFNKTNDNEIPYSGKDNLLNGAIVLFIIFVIILIICFIFEIGYIIESKEKNGKNLLFASLVPTVMETVIGFTILIIFLEQRKMKRYITCSNDSAINFLNNRLITRLNLYQSLCVSYFSLIFVPLGLAVLYCCFERIKCKKTENKEIINEKMLIEKEEQTTKGECTSELSRNSSENIIN